MNIYETYDITFLMFLNMLSENTFDDLNNYKFIIQDEVFRFDAETREFRRDSKHSRGRVVNSTTFTCLDEIITVIHIVGKTDVEEEEVNE